MRDTGETRKKKKKSVAAKEDVTWTWTEMLAAAARADLTLLYIQCRSSSRLQLAYTVAQDHLKIS